VELPFLSLSDSLRVWLILELGMLVHWCAWRGAGASSLVKRVAWHSAAFALAIPASTEAARLAARTSAALAYWLPGSLTSSAPESEPFLRACVGVVALFAAVVSWRFGLEPAADPAQRRAFAGILGAQAGLQATTLTGDVCDWPKAVGVAASWLPAAFGVACGAWYFAARRRSRATSGVARGQDGAGTASGPV
jgi:hypothetical protein